MKFVRIEAVIGLAFAMSFGLSGCGGSSSPLPPPSPPPQPISVVVSPASANVPQGGTQAFSAVVSNASNTAVNWKVQETGGGSVSNTGLYTAPNTAGTFHVVATSQADGTKTATATVSVPSVSVAINPQASTVTLSGIQIFAATVTGTIDTAVTWTIREGLAGGAIDASGDYSAPNTVGTFHVLATSAADPSAIGMATVAVVQSSFTNTGSMEAPRLNHTATLLADGKVLVAGGMISLTIVPSAELFDPSKGKFTVTGDMQTVRARHTAARLLDGRVLIVGGTPLATDGNACSTFRSAELFDPDTEVFTATGDMTDFRFGHTATTLKSGKVLIAGGVQVFEDAENGCSTFVHASAEVYDPATGSFTGTGAMLTSRVNATATLLADGKVLIAGGRTDGDISGTLAPLATAELYDPATGTFAPTESMSVPRFEHTATMLQDGRVLIVGGLDFSQATTLASAEIYDPGTGLFISTGSMESARSLHAATLLPTGEVMITGGVGSSDSDTVLSSAEVFDPVTGTFRATVSMMSERAVHTATLLQNGQVLITGGGGNSGNVLATAELYQP